MNNIDYYKEKFKTTLSEDDLQKLIERHENGERISTLDEMRQILRVTGRKAVEMYERAIEQKRETEKYNKDNNTNIEFPDWILDTYLIELMDKHIDEA